MPAFATTRDIVRVLALCVVASVVAAALGAGFMALAGGCE